MNNLPVLPQDNSIFLDPSITNQLQTQEEYESYYINLEKVSSLTSWWKADLLLRLREKFGNDSIEDLAFRIKGKAGTLSNYIRIARAFPPERRIATLSFSHHFAAASADEYNEDTDSFSGNERFDFLEKALDEAWSTRDLKAAVDRHKKLRELNVHEIPCLLCHETEGEVLTYLFFSPDEFPRARPDKLDLHHKCYWKVLEFINHG